jgi:hypothetical protein
MNNYEIYKMSKMELRKSEAKISKLKGQHSKVEKKKT